ncbi:MAG: O-antigen ligase family protein [Acidimicrobiia bacterium]|nr:O-antigen ligase family protein [Acidimicrobiia bacterium]
MRRSRLTSTQVFLLVSALLIAALIGVLVSPTVLDGKGLFLAAAAIGGAAFVLLLVEETELAILVLLASRASLDLVANRRVGPLNVAAVLGLLVIAAGVLHMINRREVPSPRDPMFPYVLFLLVCVVSLVETPDRLGGVKDLFRFTSLFFIYQLVGYVGRTERGMRRVLAAIAISGIGPILVGAYQLATGSGFTIKQGAFVRLEGTFVHPNPFSLYLALVLPALIATWIVVKEWRRWLGVIIVGLTICLVFTFTRTGWIGLVAAVLVMAWLRYRKILFVVPIVLAAVLFLIPGVGDRFSDLSSTESPSGTTTNSLDWRFAYWSEALQNVGESPVWGQGLGYIKETTEEGKEAHNDFVRVLVETGLAGFVLFVWAVGRLTKESIAAVRRRRGTPLRSAVRVAFAGTMVAYLLMSLTSNLISQPAVQWYFWSIMALAIYPTDPTDPESVAATAGAAGADASPRQSGTRTGVGAPT